MPFHKPLLLQADNFTPLARTPWAGKEIYRLYKQGLTTQTQIGESWEFSCDPEFPSHLESLEVCLSTLVTQFPEEILSPRLAKSASCEILVKLLNADDHLSVQVHPTDHDPHLKKNECGKPESWLILYAEPNCGIYIGFKPGLTKDRLRQILQDDPQALAACMNFVAVKPGDYFEIEPGIVHAIGPGIVLLEPQRIRKGMSGKTYRLYDWNRRYNQDGEPDAQGVPRPLHTEESLRIIDPAKQSGDGFIASIQKTPTKITGPGYVIDDYAANAYYHVLMVHMEAASRVTLTVKDGYGSLTMLQGHCLLRHDESEMLITAGRTALIPHKAFPLEFQGINPCQFSLVVPAEAQLVWSQHV